MIEPEDVLLAEFWEAGIFLPEELEAQKKLLEQQRMLSNAFSTAFGNNQQLGMQGGLGAQQGGLGGSILGGFGAAGSLGLLGLGKPHGP